MNFRAKIIVHRPPGPETDEGMPTYFLEDDYLTAEAARAAAQRHIAQKGYQFGEASWVLYGPDSKEVEA